MSESDETNIKLVAAFMGVTYIPHPYALGGNNLNPKLVLKKDSIEFRNLFFTRRKTYKQIKQVDVYTNSFRFFSIKTTNICLVFKDSIFTFVGNLNDLERLKELLRFFKEKGILLTNKAEKLID